MIIFISTCIIDNLDIVKPPFVPKEDAVAVRHGEVEGALGVPVADPHLEVHQRLVVLRQLGPHVVPAQDLQ